ncbi:MAG: BatD family protein [Verrucomicrobia bacterium]|nr:BatD family protein [Verrucomicrobiota bacterium]
MRILWPLLCLAILGISARGQTVRWEPAESGLSSAVALVFENCEPDGQPALPSIPGVRFEFGGQSTQINVVNTRMTRTVALTYRVRGPQNTPLQIPSFVVKTNKGDLRVPAFNVASPATPVDAIASAKLVPAKPSVWAGEIFRLDCEVSAAHRTNPRFSETFDWNSSPLVAEDWSKPELGEAFVNGERRIRLHFHTRAIAKTPNTVKLEPTNHVIAIQTGTIPFGLFAQPRMEQVSITSDQPVLEVRPLPAGAPAAFSGAVGQFKLTSRVVPDKAAVGEPVTWTLELSGSGNWPDLAGLPPRTVSSDFQVVQPKAKRTPAEGRLFDATLVEDVVLVPSKAGNYTLNPVTFVFFDPKSGSYQSITTPRANLVVTAPSAPAFRAPGPVGSATIPETGISVQEPPPAPRGPPAAPPAPSVIPRDPLPNAAPVRLPMDCAWLATAVGIPFAGVLVAWLALALQRARSLDPLRPRREAWERLAATLEHIDRAAPDAPPALLLTWQRDSALLWELRHAAPSSESLPNEAWANLWREADRALYGARSSLPTDWNARARAALVAAPVPRFQPLRLFLPRNLMPFAALLLLGVAFSLATSQAGTPGEATATTGSTDAAGAYRKGDFPAAERAWRQAVEKSPTNWAARHNLSLALAQQDRTGESAAQAAAAFVQQPGHPAVRWQFTHSADKLGAAPADLVGFANPGPLQTLAGLMSPSDWQLVLIAAAWILGLATTGFLFRAYGRGPARLRWISATAAATGVLAAVGAGLSLATYGMAADRDAVIVARATSLRSIPTEADTTQKTTPLAAGSMARNDHEFLGWRRLRFDNGQTGWVRREDLVALWK